MEVSPDTNVSKEQAQKILNYAGGNLAYLGAISKLIALKKENLIDKIPYPANNTTIVINDGSGEEETSAAISDTAKKSLAGKLAPFLLGGALTGGGGLLWSFLQPDLPVIENILPTNPVENGKDGDPQSRGGVGVEIR